MLFAVKIGSWVWQTVVLETSIYSLQIHNRQHITKWPDEPSYSKQNGIHSPAKYTTCGDTTFRAAHVLIVIVLTVCSTYYGSSIETQDCRLYLLLVEASPADSPRLATA